MDATACKDWSKYSTNKQKYYTDGCYRVKRQVHILKKKIKKIRIQNKSRYPQLEFWRMLCIFLYKNPQ